MNAPLLWRDPVVAEIHAIRDQLMAESAGSLAEATRAANAFCQGLGFTVVQPPAPSVKTLTPDAQ
jgi:hypothetical protein